MQTLLLAWFGLGLLASPASARDVFYPGQVAAGSGPPPDAYTIQRGDTLWDISVHFLGSSQYWPRLWSINDYITNPHWIYPGNRIVFRGGTLLDPPRIHLEEGGLGGYAVTSLEFESSQPECGPDVRYTEPYVTDIFMAPAFLERKRDVDVIGEVVGAKSGFVSLGEGELVYLELDDIENVECGDVYSIYERGGKIRHPNSWFTNYGHLHKVLAEVVVVHKEGDVASAVVRQSFREFNRGDMVGPVVPVRTQVAVSAPRGDLEGVIVARADGDEYSLASPGAVVFLDLGRADGVQVGSSLFVVHRRDEAVHLSRDDEDIPAQVVGRIVVVKVEEDRATGVIVDAATPLDVGDRVAMRVD